MQLPQLVAIALLGLLYGACSKPPQTGKGFYLPPGDGERGKVAFVQLKCNECHTVAGTDLPAPATRAVRIVQLGGEVTRMRSYGDLVTSIIYPSHAISDLLTPDVRKKPAAGPMPLPSDTMTVAQLVDVATFLQPHYKEIAPTTYGYGYPLPP
jgi:hypothetical protein